MTIVYKLIGDGIFYWYLLPPDFQLYIITMNDLNDLELRLFVFLNLKFAGFHVFKYQFLVDSTC